MLTREQVAETSDGRIGIWDITAGDARLGAFATGGVGPHEIRLMPGGDTLVVANGGIATGSADRSKRTLDIVRPGLAYLSLDGDRKDGGRPAT